MKSSGADSATTPMEPPPAHSRPGSQPSLTPISAATRASMRSNRRRDTKPELSLRRALFARGYRYRIDLRISAGNAHARPDIVFTRRKIAVFVDGCFWHGCPEHCKMPKTHVDYWANKIERNKTRDIADTLALEHAGWTVLRVWEHMPLEEAIAQIIAAVDED